MQYIICSPIEKLYTFRVTEQVLGELSMVMNRHFDRYVDKKFKTLDILQMMVENIK
jgi:DNA repair protein recO